MQGKDDQHTRICVLEKMFTVFQESQTTYMKNEEVAFGKLGTQLNAIFKKIDTIQAEQREEDARVVTQLRLTLDRDFVSKQNLELRMAALKTEICKEINSTKSNAYAEFFRIAAAVTLAVTLSGWIYINILHSGAGH